MRCLDQELLISLYIYDLSDFSFTPCYISSNHMTRNVEIQQCVYRSNQPSYAIPQRTVCLRV